MDMQIDVFAQHTFGKIALQKLSPVPDDFRLFCAGWVGDHKKNDTMEITGAVFRVAKSGKNKGKLSIMLPDTKKTVYVTSKEIREFEELENANK